MRIDGLTLAELLIALTIAVLLTGMAAPAFQQLISANQATHAINRFARHIALARSTAIMHKQPVVFCPSNDQQRCGRRNTWHEGALIFVDTNQNRQVDAGEWLVKSMPPIERGRIEWRAFRNRGYLKFNPSGFTAWQNGSFTYCPPDNNLVDARILILNAAGRVKVGRDTDGDGVVETASRKPARCG